MRAFIIALLMSAALYAHAQPITMVTMTGTGSLSDTVLRQVQADVEREVGQPIVVANNPGAGGLLAARQVTQAPADGRTILVGNSSLEYLALTGANPGGEGLVPLAGLAQSAFGILVPAASPAKRSADLADLQDPLVGVASPMSAMSASLLDAKLGMHSTQVPYKQFGQALADLAAGRIHYMTGPLTASAVQGLVQSGHIRVLGSLREIGVPDFGWSGFFVRSTTPVEVRQHLAAALQRAVSASRAEGALPVDGRELQRMQSAELPQMRRALGI